MKIKLERKNKIEATQDKKSMSLQNIDKGIE
jgi:hypothetical protein